MLAHDYTVYSKLVTLLYTGFIDPTTVSQPKL